MRVVNQTLFLMLGVFHHSGNRNMGIFSKRMNRLNKKKRLTSPPQPLLHRLQLLKLRRPLPPLVALLRQLNDRRHRLRLLL